MTGDTSDRVMIAAESELVSAPAPPTQFYTLRECQNLIKRNLVFLLGAFAMGIATASGGAFVGVAFAGINLFQLWKMERKIRAGGSLPKSITAPRVPKRVELWIWPPFFTLLTAGMIWLIKRDILRWLLHPVSSPVMFAFSVITLLYLFTGWLLMLRNVRDEYRRYFAAKQGVIDRFGDVAVTESPDFHIAVAGEQSETRARNSHWWTDTQVREEAKVIARR